MAQQLLRALALSLALCGAARADAQEPPLGELPIEELMRLRVSTVSRKEAAFLDAPAAIYVLTGEDLTRSGAPSVPEALRLAPGLEVAQLDSNTWAITARGFNDQFANKLLVLFDGRTVYSPLFSGVFWDERDTLLEDIERIEVLRGPAGTMWGANAVNGVINVITRDAAGTQGWLVSGGGGTEERGFGAVRYGGEIGDAAHFRLYAKVFNRDAGQLPSGAKAKDGWELGRAGFRLDWQTSPAAHATFQGDAYLGREGLTIAAILPAPPFAQVEDDPFHLAGGFLQAQWERDFDDAGELRLKAYYDHTERRARIFSEARETLDFDLLHRVRWGARHEIALGAGYRLAIDDIDGSLTIGFAPDQRTTHLFSFLAQDEIALVPGALRLIVGSRLEHNDLTAFGIQPNVRLAWTPGEDHTLWAGASHARRTPSRGEDDARITSQLRPGQPVFVSLVGSRQYQDEVLWAFELGWRGRPLSALFADLATFVHLYDRLRTFEPLVPPPPPAAAAFFDKNLMNGTAYGAEAALELAPTAYWRLDAAYTLLVLDLGLEPESQDVVSVAAEGHVPRHQLSLRSSLDLPRRVQLDLALRLVDRLRTLGIPGYAVLDARLGWEPIEGLELAVVARNLLHAAHLEFAPSVVPNVPTRVEPGVYGKLTWSF